MTDENLPWTPDGVPFVWVSKDALQRIVEGVEDASSAMLVYLALCRIACNENSAGFVKPVAYIAQLATVSRRTVERRLEDLERLKLVFVDRRRIDGTKANDLSRYTLATLSRKVTSQSRNLTSQNGQLRDAVSRELEKERGKKPLTTGERIGLERKKSIIESHIRKLEDETFYEHDRTGNPQKVEQLESYRKQLLEAENQLLESHV